VIVGSDQESSPQPGHEEIRVRRHLHASGLRFRLHQKNLPGTPDIVLKSRRTAIFANGCFWHQHADWREMFEKIFSELLDETIRFRIAPALPGHHPDTP
jgi:DNA mismatch endonuclease Vsr